MHELSLAHRVCDTVAAHIDPGQRLLCVTVECGPLCGVVPDALNHCFYLVAKSFGFEDAKLDLRLNKAPATCPNCSTQLEIESMWEVCPDCDHAPLTISGGRELRIRQIEIEEVDDV